MDKPVFDILFNALRHSETNKDSMLSSGDVDEAIRAIIERYKSPDTAPITRDIAATLRSALVEYDLTSAQTALNNVTPSPSDPSYGNAYISKRDKEHARLKPAFDWLLFLQS